MLFDEKELNELDEQNNIGTSKPIVKKTSGRVLIKDMPHYIILSSTGVLTASRVEKVERHICLLKVDNLSVADDVLNAIPDMKRRGLYMIHNWGNTSVNFGFSSLNMTHCSKWFGNMMSTLGYEASKTYQIINDPQELLTKIRLKTMKINQEEREESKRIIEDVSRLMEEKRKEKNDIEEMMMRKK